MQVVYYSSKSLSKPFREHLAGITALNLKNQPDRNDLRKEGRTNITAEAMS